MRSDFQVKALPQRRFTIDTSEEEVSTMLRYALIALVIAIIAGILGFGGIAFAAAGVAKILFVVFLILFLVGLVMHLGRGGPAV
jgi:uncharacterized membrane protein YtjA (UPF0391 family)